MRELVAEALVEAGYDAAPTGSAQEALRKLSLGEFHVAIVDLSLGDSEGLELVDAILDGSPDIQIIIITGYPSLESAIDALRRGAQDYLIKPFKLPELQAAVTRSLRNQKVEAEIRELRHRVRDQDEEIRRLRGGARTAATGRPAPARPSSLRGAYAPPASASPPPPSADQEGQSS